MNLLEDGKSNAYKTEKTVEKNSLDLLKKYLNFVFRKIFGLFKQKKYRNTEEVNLY